jgi:hypothetical protein
LSLVSFDVKDTFNASHPSVLAERLREESKPTELMARSGSFCNERKASVVLDEHELPVQDIEHAADVENGHVVIYQRQGSISNTSNPLTL